MSRYLFGCFIFLLLISPTAFGEDGTGEYLEGGPSETFETPSLDLQRSYYGIFEEPQEKPARGRTRVAKPLAEPVIKEVPTFAEVEAAKVKASADAAMETSRKAEATAAEAKQSAAEAKAFSEKAIVSANQSIETANQAIDKTNQTIDEVNAINEKVMQENAKLRFEMEQKNQGLAEDIEGLKKKIDDLTVKEAKKTFSVYTVKKGDFLIKIAGKKDVYGKGEAWKKIYQANRDKIKNPNLIYPGQILQIPAQNGVGAEEVKVKTVVTVPKKPTPTQSE